MSKMTAAMAFRGRGRSGLDDGDDESDGGQDVSDAHALGLGADLHHRLAGVVDAPGDLPALGLAAGDGLLELTDHVLEGVENAVMQDCHPGRGHRTYAALHDDTE